MKAKETLASLHWTERVRQIIYLLVYVVIIERSFPMPFIQSRFGQLIYFIILFYVFKGLWRYRQETSIRFYAKTVRWQRFIEEKRFSLTDYTRWRIMAIVRFFFMLYATGWLIDGATDKCIGALNCGVAIPSLLTDNFAELIEFALRLAMSMFSIFGMMYLMARMDLHKTILPDSIKTRFTDVYGQDNAVESLKEIRGILDYPDEIESRGGYMPGGVLLFGPPGTGKTLMAEAFAGETGKPFVAVGPESFTNMFVGVPVMKVKMLFRHLRKLAVKHGGVVCFFDEIDALGSRGSGVVDKILRSLDRLLMKIFYNDMDEMVITAGGAGSGALQMLLTEMSGLAKPKGLYNKIRVMLGFKPIPPPKYRILWIGATNMEQTLDRALLRPGRFDRKIKVGFPNIEGRAETFQGYLDKVDNDLTKEQVEVLARENPQATGASIKDAINEALLKTVREDREVITWEDVRAAILLKMAGEEEGRMELASDRRRVALHEAAHAVASHHLRPEAPIQFASVIKRSKTAGMVYATDKEERFTLKSRAIADIKVCLASVWAEKFYFDDNLSTGPKNDLQKATLTAISMFTKHGMGSTVMVWPEELPLSDSIMTEIEDWLHEVFDELYDFMTTRKDQVEIVADLLDEQGTVDGPEIHELIERLEK